MISEPVGLVSKAIPPH